MLGLRARAGLPAATALQGKRPRLRGAADACAPWSRTRPTSTLSATAAGLARQTDTTAQSEPTPTNGDREDPTRREAYLWYDTLFPIRFALWDIRGVISRLQQNDLLAQVRQLVPEDPRYAVAVESVEPRAKDGGAFVRLTYSVPDDVVDRWKSALSEHSTEDEGAKAVKSKEMEEKVTSLIEREARAALEKSGFRPWFSLGRPCLAHLVQGVPWQEDLDRFPSREIQVEMSGPPIPQEELYAIFRPYGRIHDIVPGDKVARIIYTSIRSATAARNCLHAAAHTSRPPNAEPKTTVLRLFYTDKKRASWLKDFAANHPRITIPLLVALLGSLSYFVWDPIRETVVKAKVEGTLDANRWRIVRWVKRETLGRLGLSGEGSEADALAAGRTGIEEERQQAKEQLSTWLKDVPDTFIVLTGPRGSGKSGLVSEVLADGRNVLTIDCEEMLKSARTESKIVSALASSTGYWPQFAFASSVSNLVDLATMGLIGQKAGFSASFEEQLKAILEVTGSALSSIAMAIKARTAAVIEQSAKRKETAGQRKAIGEQLRSEGVRDGRLDAVAGAGVLAELGGGVEGPVAGVDKQTKEQSKYEIIGPRGSALVRESAREHGGDANGDQPSVGFERLPVVVIKGFATKGDKSQEVLWDVLSEWSAVLVENQVAHVIFTSDSMTTIKPLAKALPSKPFNLITLNDASPDASLQYVSAKLAAFDQTLPTDAQQAVALLGGRQTDLELLVQKIRAGQTASEAVEDLIQRNASEIHKKLFGDDEEEAKSFKWSKQQALDLVKGLSGKGDLKYAETLLTTFGGDDTPLRALEAASLVSIQHVNGRPSIIKPGKPVYRAACELLLRDAPFRAAIEYRTAVAGISSASASVAKAQAELIELSKLFAGEQGRWAFGGGSRIPKEVEVRVGQLLAQMRAGEEKAEKLGQEKDRLMQILREHE